MNETISGLSAVSVREMVTLLSQTYLALVRSGEPLKRFPSVMLWGPPGVGKSQGVRQIARALERQTDKRVAITDVRLLLFNPVDLRGIPTANAEKTLAVWLKPQIFQMDDGDDVINILFLDEISAAPPSVQAAAYQITLDRMVGEHKLPDNCIVIAAGNRTTDRSVAYHMPSALANRLCHLEIKSDTGAWHDWAVNRGIHPLVVGYLEYNAVALMRTDDADAGPAFPTPRSWEMVSRVLQTASSDVSAVYPLIVGCIGADAAARFRRWWEMCSEMPSVESVFTGEASFSVPPIPELQIALRTQMVAYARTHPTQEGIDRSIEFACNLPWAFRGQLMHDYRCTPSVREIVKQNAVYQTAVKDGRL